MDALLPFVTAHPLLIAALALSLLAILGNEVHGSLTAGPSLGPAGAVRLINDRDARLVDVRPAADFKKGHLLGAVNIPHDKLKARLTELEKDKSRPVILYCALGGTARESALLLKKAGFAEAYPLAGGLNAWISASLPVTSK
ncbi:MAG: rhodanese-like domain-containing protein [Stagnimonas sp.]|nr:rhodanese-like domain-containing protein [Stagnimonas sp.]